MINPKVIIDYEAELLSYLLTNPELGLQKEVISRVPPEYLHGAEKLKVYMAIVQLTENSVVSDLFNVYKHLTSDITSFPERKHYAVLMSNITVYHSCSDIEEVIDSLKTEFMKRLYTGKAAE